MRAESTDWPGRIKELVLIKQRIRELDIEGVWEHYPPRPGATENELLAVEAHLNEPLDPCYRSCLTHVGGWPAILRTIDLFGPADLIAGPQHDRGQELLSGIEDFILGDLGVPREQVLPIAATPVDLDLFVMTRRAAPEPGSVIWLAGYEIEIYPSFDDFFQAIVKYNTRMVYYLEGEAAARG